MILKSISKLKKKKKNLYLQSHLKKRKQNIKRANKIGIPLFNWLASQLIFKEWLYVQNLQQQLCTYKAGLKHHVKHFLLSACSKTKFKNWSYQVTHLGVFNILFQDRKGGCLFSFGISPEPQQSKFQCISLRWTLNLPPLLSSSYYTVFKSKFLCISSTEADPSHTNNEAKGYCI